MSPISWLRQFARISHHHSRPFYQFSQWFGLDDSTSASMPSKWSCQCGTSVPITLSYCGNCGLRWDKVNKSNNKSTAKPKQPAKDSKDANLTDPADGSRFSVPSVGLAWQVDSHQMSTSRPTKVQQPKSLQTLIHQKANRAGKITARIAKLEQAVEFVQTGWPSHVQAVQQQLQIKYAEVCRFQADVRNELVQLRQELEQLSMLGHTPVPQGMTHAVTAQQVQTAMEVLSAVGLAVPNYVCRSAHTDGSRNPSIRTPDGFSGTPCSREWISCTEPCTAAGRSPRFCTDMSSAQLASGAESRSCFPTCAQHHDASPSRSSVATSFASAHARSRIATWQLGSQFAAALSEPTVQSYDTTHSACGGAKCCPERTRSADTMAIYAKSTANQSRSCSVCPMCNSWSAGAIHPIALTRWPCYVRAISENDRPIHCAAKSMPRTDAENQRDDSEDSASQELCSQPSTGFTRATDQTRECSKRCHFHCQHSS